MRAILIVLALAALAAIGVAMPGASTADPPQPPTNAIPDLSDRFVPKPAGTKEDLKLYFGPYVVPPGHDANRVDLQLPGMTGYIQAIEPGMRRVADLTEPSHQEGHIHHAHWFALDIGNEEDNYTYGNTEWVFGNGDEETRADFQERSAADPKGPVYGQYVTPGAPQLMIYMLHNKTNQPLVTYIVLDVTFIHGTPEELKRSTGREHHDVSGVLFGRTYDVPRQPSGDGTYVSSTDSPRGPIRWTSTVEGTMIGTGGHLHPGGLSVVVENLGSKENPCPDDGRGYGGTLLLKSDAIFRSGVMFSEDFQMEVSHPAWRAPIRKGDVIQITGVYENKDHGWYDVMTHEGIYVDEAQPPKAGCKPTLINQPSAARRAKRKAARKGKQQRARRQARRSARGKGGLALKRRGAKRRRWGRARLHMADPTQGVANRAWHVGHPDLFCGAEYGGPPCERPYTDRGPGMETNLVTIANFLYVPGDYSLSGQEGAPPRVKKGTPMTFVNGDQEAGIRHSVTTCQWPCTGRYVANHPLPDGLWDSSTLGYDPIDGGNPNPVANTPSDLPVGKYSYFCRIHPWMRGAFEVVE
jgi:plastocyanin